MKTPHKHADIIKAWADGEQIEFLNQHTKQWVPIGTEPCWFKGSIFRIKPEPKPDVVTHDCVQLEHDEAMFAMGEDNLKLTWCGETGKLKSAEVLK